MWFLAAIALLGLGATFFVESSFVGRAVEVQPIERDPKSESGWRLVGDPVSLLDVPNKAFVTRGAPGIPPQVDAAKLRGNERVIPYGPIRNLIQTARWGALLALLLMIAGQVALKRVTISVPDDIA